MDKQFKHWEIKAQNLLVNRTIKEVRYMTKKEANQFGWNDLTLIIVLDDGTALIPSQDSEGNGAGVFFTNNEELSTIPTVY